MEEACTVLHGCLFWDARSYEKGILPPRTPCRVAMYQSPLPEEHGHGNPGSEGPFPHGALSSSQFWERSRQPNPRNNVSGKDGHILPAWVGQELARHEGHTVITTADALSFPSE
ncbi:hypothetical protein FKM82_027466 [Ascaphus truei]